MGGGGGEFTPAPPELTTVLQTPLHIVIPVISTTWKANIGDLTIPQVKFSIVEDSIFNSESTHVFEPQTVVHLKTSCLYLGKVKSPRSNQSNSGGGVVMQHVDRCISATNVLSVFPVFSCTVAKEEVNVYSSPVGGGQSV